LINCQFTSDFLCKVSEASKRTEPQYALETSTYRINIKWPEGSKYLVNLSIMYYACQNSLQSF